MSADDPTDRRERVTPGQVGAGVASLAEAWLRDAAFGVVGLFSVIVVIVGLITGGAGSVLLAVVLGVLAFVVPFYAVVRRLSAPRIWLGILVGAVADAVALALLLTR